MAARTLTAVPARATRRLDQDRANAILRATYDLLGESGYQGLRVDAVCARAQASKATVYRHWPTKAVLVVDAVRSCKMPDPVAPDTGSLRGDLVAWFDILAHTVAGEEGPILAGLVMAITQDPELAAELRSMRESKVPNAKAILGRAEQRGELRPGYDPELIDEIVPSQLFMRYFALGQPLDDAYIAHLVDDIILPLLVRHQQP